MSYIFNEPEIKNLKVIRPTKEFLLDFKKTKMEAEAKPSKELIIFLDWLIDNVRDEVKINSSQEKNLSEGIDWYWWSTYGEPHWYLFLNLFEIVS